MLSYIWFLRSLLVRRMKNDNLDRDVTMRHMTGSCFSFLQVTLDLTQSGFTQGRTRFDQVPSGLDEFLLFPSQTAVSSRRQSSLVVVDFA
jgi:hypothetical protein